MAKEHDDSQIRSISELSPEFIGRWRELFENSISPNIYLSPDFVLTALQTFYDADVRVAYQTSDNELQALAVIELERKHTRFPFDSLKLFKTKHSFQTGLLLRQGIDDACLDAFMVALLRETPCIRFVDFCLESQLARRIQESAVRLHLSWYENKRYPRAILRTDITINEWEATIRPKKLKEYNRTRLRLGETGDLSWNLVSSEKIMDESVETFLNLEHEGWKREAGGSLLSHHRESEFFRRLVVALKKQSHVFFTEVTLDGSIIASTVNFITRNRAFAFKVAWQPSLSKFSPGILNEVLFIKYVAQNEVQFSTVESGAGANSYIDNLWPDRVEMFSGYLMRGWGPKTVAWSLSVARSIERTARSLHARITQRQ